MKLLHTRINTFPLAIKAARQQKSSMELRCVWLLIQAQSLVVVEQDRALHILQPSSGNTANGHRTQNPELALPLTMTTSPLSVPAARVSPWHWEPPTAFCTPSVPKAQALISMVLTGNPPLSGWNSSQISSAAHPPHRKSCPG